MDLVPIKVKIGLKDVGGADYPDFNQLQVIKDSGLDWSKYIDIYGTGWHYDSVGHKEERNENGKWDSPHGQQWGMILVPKDFADQAVAQFPQQVEKITETDCEDFYDNCHAVDFSEEKVNEEALRVFEVKERMGVQLSGKELTKKQKALDPDDSEPGITRNWRKTWSQFKGKKNINIVQ